MLLERPVPMSGNRGHIDIWLGTDQLGTAIELKFGTRRSNFSIDGDEYDLRDGAPDWFRYDVWKDVSRVESLIEQGNAESGFVIALTNDHLNWSEASPETISAAFSMHEGNDVHGSLGWSSRAGSGSTSGRESAIELGGRYVTRWSDYSLPAEGSGGEFRYLLLDVRDALKPL